MAEVEEICYACDSKVDRKKDPACKAQGNLYHADCFVCEECDISLLGQPFFPHKGKILCKKDFQAAQVADAKRCHRCIKPIMTQILTIGEDRHYHPECFTCIECRCSLNGIRYLQSKEGVTYCYDCYQQLFLPRCNKCGNPIAPPKGSDESDHVVSDDKEFHIECYRCELCNVQFDGEKVACYPMDELLYCYHCHVKVAAEHAKLSKFGNFGGFGKK